MRNLLTNLFLLALLLGLTGCGEVSLAGKYNNEQDGYGFGPGADKIILDLRVDKTFDVTAGPLTMLDGTWEAKSGELTLSHGEGNLVTTYRAEGLKLLPMKDGMDVPGWRWKRK